MNEFRTVLAAEIMRRVRSRAFKVGLIIGVVGVALAIKAPEWIGAALNRASHSIIVGGPASINDRAAKLLSKDFAIEDVVGQTNAPAQLLTGHPKAGALVMVGTSGRGITVSVYARDLSFVSAETIKRDLVALNVALATASSETSVNRYMNVPIALHSVNSKFGSAAAADAAKGLAYGLLFFLYLSILFNSQLIMTSVAEEKTSRIAELLVASVNPSALLAGKIAAAAFLAVIQMASWLAVAYFVSGFGEGGSGFSTILRTVTPLEAVAFAIYFILGYLQLSTLFAAAASLVNRTEDLGSLSGPLVMPVIFALFIAIYALGFPNSPLVMITSFIPIVAPFTMFARIGVSIVPVWQIILSVAINVAAVWAFALLAGKVYRVGMLLYGRPPKLSQLWSALRT
ncbi:MAG: ABC transporter permease [Candidatus Eremiobacteraeota bacterium]|nr:ABC transporter permease [Candidatus Eremiobacteraeota bacterium]